MFKEERRKILKSKRIDDSIKININLQQPPTTTTTTSESSISIFTKDIKKLRKIVENQNLQIQLLQEKTDSLETKDSEKQAQIQSKNDEIIRLKQTIQSQQENHLFLFNSNAKIWTTLNNLEKQISSNSKNSESNESEKEITFLDIKKYLQKNPKEAADIERIARDVRNSLGKKLSDLNESDSESEKDENLLRKRNDKRQRRMGEKSYKQKNVDDYVKSTIDEKLEKFATAMPDQFDDDDWSSWEKNDSEKQKHVSHRHCRSSPTNSIVNVLTNSLVADNPLHLIAEEVL
uniref:Uncharacterized protein n=1 Tax=Panagrolaimus davidi TaxID=227884 RepID=A0A914QH80_9BILA